MGGQHRRELEELAAIAWELHELRELLGQPVLGDLAQAIWKLRGDLWWVFAALRECQEYADMWREANEA